MIHNGDSLLTNLAKKIPMLAINTRTVLFSIILRWQNNDYLFKGRGFLGIDHDVGKCQEQSFKMASQAGQPEVQFDGIRTEKVK